MDIDELQHVSEDTLFPYRGDIHAEQLSPFWSVVCLLAIILVGVFA